MSLFRPCRRFLLLEVSVVETLESGAVTGLILCHLVYGVVNSVVVEFLCPLCDCKLALACSGLSLDSLLEIGLGIPYYITEKFSELGSVLSLFESISLESLGDLRIALAVGLAAHRKIHSHLAALAVEVSLKSFVNLLVAVLGNTDDMLAGPALRAFFLKFSEFVSLCVTYRTFCRRVLTFIYISADKTSEFLLPDLCILT